MKKTSAQPQEELIKQTPAERPLERRNFIMMIVAGAMIVLGFLLMLGSPSTPDAYNPDIFSTRRIVVGPTISLLGFIAMGVAIIYRPRKEEAQSK